MEQHATGSSTVTKALVVLDALGELMRVQPEGATLSELSRATGYQVSSTYRYLLPFVSSGLVIQEPLHGRYRLGLRVVELAAICLQSVNVRSVARPYLVDLMRQTQETVYLGVPDGLQVVYMDRIDSPLPIRPHTMLGGSNPLNCTAMGKAMLASDSALAAAVLRSKLIGKTPRSLVTAEALSEDLAATHARGFAVDDMESETEVRCAAAAVLDHTGAVVGAMSVSGPATRVTVERINTELGPLVRAAALDVSRALGYNPGNKVMA